MVSKKKKKAEKRKRGFLSKPLICKIEIKEHGKQIMEFKGDIRTGFERFKTIAEDVFQVVDKKKGEKIDTEEQ